MHNFIKQQTRKLKATVKYIIVAFIFSIIILSAIYILFSEPINEASSIVELISQKSSKRILKDVKIDKKTNTLTSRPRYKTTYAKLKIPSIDVELPVYYGDDLEILKYGVGQTPGSFFPGEGGSIVYMAHNTSNMLRRLTETKIGDKIIVEAVYGTYIYQIDSAKVIEETEIDAVSIEEGQEIIKMYTCYPPTAITHTPYRYIVYASRIEG